MTVLAVYICMIDRIAISIAIIPMAEDNGWSATVQGAVMSAFFLGYVTLQIPAGYLSDRFGGRSSVRQEPLGRRTEIVVCLQSRRFRCRSPLWAHGRDSGLVRRVTGRPNKKRVVGACLLYSSAPTCRDGDPQC